MYVKDNTTEESPRVLLEQTDSVVVNHWSDQYMGLKHTHVNLEKFSCVFP